MCIRFPLWLRNVVDLLNERGIEISHKTLCFWWNSFGPMFFAQDGGRGARAALCVEQWLTEWRRFDGNRVPSSCWPACTRYLDHLTLQKLPFAQILANVSKGP